MTATVLIVSAEKFTRNLCSQTLTPAAGFSLDFVADGPDGLFALSDGRHKIALVEYDMDEMNGLEFLKRIRSGRSRAERDMSIGMLSGSADKEILTTAVALDLNSLLVTPISQKDIIRRTGKLLTDTIVPKPTEAYDAVKTPLSPRQIQRIAAEGRSPLTDLHASGQRSAPRAPSHALRAAQPSQPGRYGPRMRKPVPELGISWQITDDIHGPNGVRLIGAGTILTPHLLSRLRHLFGEGKLDAVWARAPIAPS